MSTDYDAPSILYNDECYSYNGDYLCPTGPDPAILRVRINPETGMPIYDWNPYPMNAESGQIS